MSYGHALKLAASENPALFRRLWEGRWTSGTLQSAGHEGARLVAGAATKKPATIDEARAELKAITEEFFGYVWKHMEDGKGFDAAFTAASREHPELNTRERQIRDWIEALGKSQESLAASGRAVPLRVSDVQTAGEAEAAVLRLVEDKQGANPGMSYGQALKLVANENPALFRRREILQRRFK
jgi:hypothetical protein